MYRSVFGWIAVAALTWLCAGCAPKALVLAPGRVPTPSGEAKYEGPGAWSLWVAETKDVRPPQEAGQRVGTLYTRFERSPQPAFLDQSPAMYLTQQLSLYLLHRGLEASDSQNAKVLLSIELEQFALKENPGTVYDEIMVDVGYTIRFLDVEQKELGAIRLKGSKQLKPAVNAKTGAEEAFREVIADTFAGLAKSADFNKILGELE